MATGDEQRNESPPDAVKDIKQRVASGAAELQEGAKERAERLSAGLGERAGHIAQAVRSAGESLQGKEDWLADAANALGQRLESLSAAATEKGLSGIRRDAEHLARERPAVFMGAAVMAGLALGRVLRSSPPEQGASEHGGTGDRRGTVATGSGAGTAPGGGRGARTAVSPAYAAGEPKGGRDGTE
jgi:hypothetical protein